MRQFTTIMLASFLTMASSHAYSVELELDDPIAPIKRESEIKPPPKDSQHLPKEKQQRPVRPDLEKVPSQDQFNEDVPAIDPDAEQVNRGELSPR